ncbi:MAG TPA: histidine kinase, partial [Gemmatimonadaceae bacterium]|nr:histidine kinase [Gemmatimonadaceae bacterium]
LLGVAVYRFTQRLPWPQPFRLRFLVAHTAAALLYGAAWIALASVVMSLVNRRIEILVGPGPVAFLVLGVWLYLIVAGVAYAAAATARAAAAEAEAARARLQAMRSQLHPHFVFNALHTVIQLIPSHPSAAAEAAESLAHVLRTSIEEDRDLVPLRDEWAFVERYVAIERLRFGDRLRVHAGIAPDAVPALLPSFALQTLVENAVRHGAGPRPEPTDLTISAGIAGGALRVVVTDTGAGADAARLAGGSGSGLRRLRSRLDALCPGSSLVLEGGPRGVTATLVVPQDEAP